MKASYCAIAAIFSLIAFTFVSCDSGTDDGGQTAKPVADFDFSVEEGTGNVTFMNKSADAVSYEWEFGDDKDGFSTEENPSYTYDRSGDYTVVLTAINGDAVDVAEKIVTISLSEEKPTINISLEDGSIDDWAKIPWREDVSMGGPLEGLKTAATEDDLYILIRAKADLITNTGYTALGFDMDYDFTTGWNVCPFTKDQIAGADVMQEVAGFHVWGWRLEERAVGWDWIYDGWLEYGNDLDIEGSYYKEWHVDMKRARTELLANPVFSQASEEDIEDWDQFATEVSSDKIRGYIWFRNAAWEYVASFPAEGGVPFDIQMGEYLETGN